MIQLVYRMLVFQGVGLILLMGLAEASLPAEFKNLRQSFQGVQGFEVSFQQEVKQDFLADQPEPAQGKIRLQREPGWELHWVYESPESKEIFYDGTDWWMTQEGERTQIPPSEQLSLDQSFSFLWGGSHPDLQIEESDDSSFVVRPNDPQKAGFQKVEVGVENARVAWARLYDLMEGESHYRFSEWELHKNPR